MNILILCTGNSCRSQMAEGWIRHFAGDRADVYSAGVSPHQVHPRAIGVMAEAGIDISHHTSNHVDEFLDKNIDIVLTVCDNAREHCPVFPRKVRQFHRAFHDPTWTTGTEEEIMDDFRRVRDEIRAFAREFVAAHVS